MSRKRKNLILEAAILATAAAGLLLTVHCGHQGLARTAANVALDGCVEWAHANGDAELLVLCKTGRPLTEILDLFASRQRAAMSRDAGSGQ